MRLAVHQEVTEEWWSDHRHEYDLHISDLVLDEAGDGDAEFASSRTVALAGISNVTEEVDELAGRLLGGGLIPVKAAQDAFHVAMSAVHGTDFLLAWNCLHPPALPFRAVLRPRLSRFARLHPHQQREHQPPHGAHLCGGRVRMPGDLPSKQPSAMISDMKTDNIIGEIRRVREKQAAKCGFDPKRIGERIRHRQRERAAHGVRYVAPPQVAVVREMPEK